MNFPNPTFWSNLLGTVGLEVCVVVAIGIAAQSAFRRAYWKRAMWQMTLLCLVLISASEWTGAGRGAGLSLFGKKRIEQTVAPQTLSSNTEFYTTKTIPAVMPPLPALQKPVWWPGLIWLAGIVIVLGRMTTAQGLLFLLRLRRKKIVDSDLQERVAVIAKMLGLRRKVCLLRLPESISPMAFGILFPTIGLPPGFETAFSAVEQDAILAHELAHLAVLDPLWFRLADFASALLWWHPLAWWARRSLHGASELAADEATALVPDGPDSLAHCLVSLGKKMTVSRGWGWTGINGGFRSKLGKRVERLTRMSAGHGRPSVSWRDRLTGIAATLLIVPSIVLLFGAFQTAKGEKENAWRNSWNSSPGVLLAMAAAEETASHEDKPVIADLLQDAKLLYEKDKFDEAEVILVHILKHDPSNKTAASYLDIVKESRFKDTTNKDLMIWAEREVVATANYLDHSNILSKLGALPETKLGSELLTTYTNLADSELKEKSVRLFYAKEQMTAVKAVYSRENPKYKTALEQFQQAKDDYDNEAVAIFEGIRDRVDQESNYLQIIKHKEEDIKTKYKQQTEIPTLEASNQTPPQETIAERITDAKLLYEKGNLEESKKILTQVLQDDPANQNAAYYLALIKEAQFMDRARKRSTSPRAIPLAANDHRQEPTYGRQFILYKLKTIHLEEVSYDLPLTEVLKQLTVLSQKTDPEGLGINFIVKNRTDFVSQQSNTPTGATSITLPIAMDSVKIKISPALHDLCLRDVLEAIVMSADQPIEYKVEDDAVVFSPKPEAHETLYLKTFHLDPVTFKRNLRKVSAERATEETPMDDGPRRADDGHDSLGGPASADFQVGLNFVMRTNDTVQLDQMIRAYFEGLGVDMTEPGKSIFYNDRQGLMLVRVTAQDLQLIEQAMRSLNQTSQQALPEPAKAESLYTKAFPLNFQFKKNLMAAVEDAHGSDVERTNDAAQLNQLLLAYFAKVGAKITPPDETIVSDDRASVLIVRATSEKLQIIEQAIQPLNKVPAQVTIEADVVELSQQEARELGFEHFWQTKENNLTSVMTPSEYRTVINTIKQNTHEDILTMVRITTLSGRQAHVAAQDLHDNVPVGPVYDMIPTVLDDGYTIKAVFIPTYTDFLQNDPPGSFTPSATTSSGTPVAAPGPLPHYRMHQTISTREVRDGQTLVAGQLVSDKPSEPRKLQLYFVTPTIIDAVGNRVHSDEELSNQQNQNP